VAALEAVMGPTHDGAWDEIEGTKIEEARANVAEVSLNDDEDLEDVMEEIEEEKEDGEVDKDGQEEEEEDADANTN